MNVFQNEKGFVGFEVVLFISIVVLMFVGAYYLFTSDEFKKKDRINIMEHEGVISSKYKEDDDDSTAYYLILEGLYKEEIKLSVNKKTYDAITTGNRIKYISYQYKKDGPVRYELGTKDSLGTVILVVDSM